jgi:hypothetical protein
MKRLGLALIIASLVFLLVGQATALPEYDVLMTVNILAQPITVIDPLTNISSTYNTTIDYDVTNNGELIDGDIYMFGISFEDQADVQFARYITIEVPNGPDFVDGQKPNYGTWMVFSTAPDVTHWAVIPGTGISDTGHFAVAAEITGNLSSQEVVAYFTGHGMTPFPGQAATPEPTTLLLIGSGLIAIAGYARIRKKKRKV